MPDLRLALPALALWLCCGIGIAVSAAMPVVAVATGILAVAALLAAVGVRRGSQLRSSRRGSARGIATVAVALATCALGATVIGAQGPQRTDAVLEAAAEQHRQVDVAVRVESAPRATAAGLDGIEHWRLRGTTVPVNAANDRSGSSSPGARSVDAGSVDAGAVGAGAVGAGSVGAGPVGARPVGGGVPVSLVVPGDARSVRAFPLGSVIAASVSVRPNEPGEATTFSLRASTTPVVRDQPPAWLAWAAPLRDSFARGAGETPGDGGDLLPGLAIGDETAVSSDLDGAMKTAALSHLTAVSGANCSLVTGLVFLLARGVGLGRRSRIVAAAAALAAFVALVGPGASVLRAAAMATVVLVGLARGRVADGVPALALAVIVLLVHDPWLARDYGFALSALATAGLLLLARPLATELARWLPRSVALALAVPLAAQLACQPVLILLTPTLPLFGIVANLVAEPAAPVATVLGCVACLLMSCAPAIGQLVVWIAWLPSAWIAVVARFSAGLPGAAVPWPEGLLGVGLCALALLAVALVAARRRVPRVIAASAAIALAGGAVVYAGSLGGRELGLALGRPGDWMVAACDVGQGDALVLRDGDRAALIDVGRRPQPIAACLDALGIAHLDWVLLTHYDADHVGGVEGVFGRTDLAIVGEPGRPADHLILDRLKAAGLRVEAGRFGMSGRLGGVGWRIVWPPPAAPGGSQLSGNAGSLVVRTEGHGLRALFLGDLGEEPQNGLLASGEVEPVDVVKVAHHGSADQSADLYRDLHARLGLVSVGADNGYGHPTNRALSMLQDAGTAAARTDRSGMLLVSASAAGPVLWVERPEEQAHGQALHRQTLHGQTLHGHGVPVGAPYPGWGRGGTWQHEATAEAARTGARAGRARRARSRSSRGTRSGPPRWSWCRERRASSPIAPPGCCATSSSRRIRAWRSATSRRRTTPRASCSRSRAPPCSASRG